MSITIAMPTGRIYKESAELLERSGIGFPAEALEERKLRFEHGGRTFILTKDADVPTYVEHGVADAGIVGRDILAEYSPNVYRPLDLEIGRCRMVVARPEEAVADGNRVLRVATKYTSVATRFFHDRGIPIELIPLAGSVELAPLLGLADVIVDLVQTGKTLEANGLVVDEVLFESTACLVLNRASYRLKTRVLRELVDRLAEEVAA